VPDPIILVVDDEPWVLTRCKAILEKALFKVMACTSASQALAILARQPVSLLLADIDLPGLDDFQMLNLARSHQPELVLVLMTTTHTVEVAISALEQGVNSLIQKPFSEADLIQAIKRSLKENEHRRDLLDVMEGHGLGACFRITLPEGEST